MVKVFDKKEELVAYAADQFISLAEAAIKENGKFVVALTGGSSPIAIHKLLASVEYQTKIDWNKVYVFWGDERWVPLNDDKSNAKMGLETLLNHVNIPKENIFPMYKDGVKPEEYAAEYEQIIKKIVPTGAFDLIQLGMGDDAHTASLFPREKIIHEQQKWVDAYYLAPQSMYRITLTAPLINLAKNVHFIVFGENKAPALNKVLHGDFDPEKYPSQLIKPAHGELVFLTDTAAAGQTK